MPNVGDYIEPVVMARTCHDERKTQGTRTYAGTGGVHVHLSHHPRGPGPLFDHTAQIAVPTVSKHSVNQPSGVTQS